MVQGGVQEGGAPGDGAESAKIFSQNIVMNSLHPAKHGPVTVSCDSVTSVMRCHEASVTQSVTCQSHRVTLSRNAATHALSRSQRPRSARVSANSDLVLGKHSPQNLSLTAFIVSQVNCLRFREFKLCL